MELVIAVLYVVGWFGGLFLTTVVISLLLHGLLFRVNHFTPSRLKEHGKSVFPLLLLILGACVVGSFISNLFKRDDE